MTSAKLTATSGKDISSKPSPQDVVDAYQRDLLRLAFVLSGDEDVAIYLARDVLLNVLQSSNDEETDPQSWSRLMIALGKHYVAGADPESHSNGASDDERTRLREAVELLSRPMRTALVLRDLGGLQPGAVAEITGIGSTDLDDVLDWSRDQLIKAAGRRSGDPPQRLLASLAIDAPGDDLWPEIAPVIEEQESVQQRFTRRIVAGTLIAMLGFTVGGVIWFTGGIPFVGNDDQDNPPGDDVVIVSSPVPTRPPRPTATAAPSPTNVERLDAVLGDQILIQTLRYDTQSPGAGEPVWFAYDANAGQALNQVDVSGTEPRNISPDGHWIVMLRWSQRQTQDPTASPSRPILTAMRDGVDQGWEYEIPTPARSFSSWDSAILGDRLYVITNAPEPATITSIDLTSGNIIATRTLEVPRLGSELRAGFVPPPEGDWGISTRLFVMPDAVEPALYAFITLSQYGPDIRDLWTRWMYQIDPDDLLPGFLNTNSVTATEELGDADQAQRDFALYNARVLPDHSGLYSLDPANRQMRIQVLDLHSGNVQTISTAFSPNARDSPDGPDLTTVISNDGRKLYVLSDLTGEVAIIDLVARRLERTFPLDFGGLSNKPIAGGRLSHDGRWLFLIQNVADQWEPAGNFHQPPESNPVWVVDLTTWRMTGRFEVPGAIESVYLDPHGQRVQFIVQMRADDGGSWPPSHLLTYDTSTFDIVDSIDLSDSVTGNARFYFRPGLDLYRETYGNTPEVDGIESDDVAEFTTLPRVRVTVQGEQAPVGVTVPVELAFLDPATGEPLTQPDSHVRYDPGQPVILVFEQPGQKSLVSVPAELAPGQQSGTVRLKAEGIWDARIVSGDNEDGFALLLRGAIRATPTFEATDGGSYVLRIETEPEEPAPVGEFVIRAAFVDATTGEVLPEDVDLIGGLPDTMRASLIGTGALSRELIATGHGVYEATITIPDSGSWSTRLIFRQPETGDTRSTQIEVGNIDIVAETSR